MSRGCILTALLAKRNFVLYESIVRGRKIERARGAVCVGWKIVKKVL